MSRGCRVVILSVGIGAVTAGAMAGAVSGAAPPTSPPAAETVAPTTAGATVTVPGGGVATTPTVPPAGTRGGATEGSVAKPTNETWSLRRIATLTALAIVALSSAGYAYGRVRSTPPRHPDLVRHPDDFDGIDNPHVGAPG